MNALMKKNSSICEEYLDTNAVVPVFQESKQAEDGRMFFLDKMHWVAVTSEFYFDDSRKYRITYHKECIQNLEELISAEDSDNDVSSTLDQGELKCLNNLEELISTEDSTSSTGDNSLIGGYTEGNLADIGWGDSSVDGQLTVEKGDPIDDVSLNKTNKPQLSQWKIEKNTLALSKEAIQKLLLYCSVEEKPTQKELHVMDINLVYLQQMSKPEHSHL